ncbi:hypothetical protein DAETH_31350 [Deinococcus aetherius]|uniref:Antitoxin n=1 Tax=Deinococcus aetherius TaxID=200252 RepID=A0ABM8AH91_9DEIO|nr:BrnA antitoxin family protein [Deinococcus aetherius]BDP43166.1 hypothetical protein DAETH_31350 [Deinococcus aetherius]
MTDQLTKLIPVRSNSEIPENMTTEEAAQFWETHTATRELIEESRNDPEGLALLNEIAPRQRPRQPRQPKATHVTTLRLDEDMEKRLKHVAALKRVPYQTLLKQFVGERLYEEEKRLGVV